MDIYHADRKIIAWFKRVSIPAARFALFIIFFWFGFLKIVGASPAEPLVQGLFMRTIPFIPFSLFYTMFGLYECLIGILFLVPRATRLVILLLAFHMFATFLPLVLLPGIAWAGWFVPTLNGQYILKNLVIIALAIGIAADITPLAQKYK